jgi:hypothetical protein
MPDTPWLDIDGQRRLYADWFSFYAQGDDLTDAAQGTGEDHFVLGDAAGFHVVARFEPSPPYLSFHPNEESQRARVEDTAARAYAHVIARETGGPAWHSVTLNQEPFRFESPSDMSLLMLQMGNQVRIQGWRRLGGHVLLEFEEKIPDDWGDKPEITVPPAIVHVHFAVPGPIQGLLSGRTANNLIELVAAICGLALGRQLRLPGHVFPTPSEAIEGIAKPYADPRIGQLARDGVSLDVFSLGSTTRDRESLFSKLQGSFLAFDAASRLHNDPAATILYVAAAEALTAPNAPWKRERLTTRFIKFFMELMPDQLDQIISHGNFEAAFRISRGNRSAQALRRELLDRLYEFRSGQLHEGLSASWWSVGSTSHMPRMMRRGLASDFAQQAIVRFLDAPRSSLIGHPKIWPPPLS